MIDLYDFIAELNRLSSPEDIICPSASGYGTLICLQSWRLKPGQRFTTNFVFGQMGAGLSTAIGATMATGKRVLLIEGDGGFQLNVQELAVVRRLNLPIIMFIINNNGYHSIREMQKNRFDGRLVACDDTSGVRLPELYKIASLYDIHFGKLIDIKYTTLMLEESDDNDNPQLVEVMADPNQQYRHKLKSQLVDGKWQWQKLEEIE
jgi:acetolactate synthase-1/2/3 large subunit